MRKFGSYNFVTMQWVIFSVANKCDWNFEDDLSQVEIIVKTWGNFGVCLQFCCLYLYVLETYPLNSIITVHSTIQDNAVLDTVNLVFFSDTNFRVISHIQNLENVQGHMYNLCECIRNSYISTNLSFQNILLNQNLQKMPVC